METGDSAHQNRMQRWRKVMKTMDKLTTKFQILNSYKNQHQEKETSAFVSIEETPKPTNILSWNCRGAGNPRTVRELQDFIWRADPCIIFLCETKCQYFSVKNLMSTLGMRGMVVNSKGTSGGLALMWKKDVDVIILGYIDRYIDAEIRGCLGLENWRLTGYYGEPDVSLKESWSNLTKLKEISNLPWVCFGDFNEVLQQKEFIGRSGGRAQWQINRFKEALDECNLKDMGFEGHEFTWCRNKDDPNSTRARLDRVCSNEMWSTLFPNAQVFHMEGRNSDHSPIKLTLQDNPLFKIESREKKPFSFSFEGMHRYGEPLKKSWPRSCADFWNPLEACEVGLFNYIMSTSLGNMKHGSHFFKKKSDDHARSHRGSGTDSARVEEWIDYLEGSSDGEDLMKCSSRNTLGIMRSYELFDRRSDDQAQSQQSSGAYREQVKEWINYLKGSSDEVDLMKRCKTLWYDEEGARNVAFFDAHASKMCRKNLITASFRARTSKRIRANLIRDLRCENGVWREQPEEIGKNVDPFAVGLNAVTERVPLKFPAEMNGVPSILKMAKKKGVRVSMIHS